MTDSSRVGHILLSDRGEMLAPDAGFCALLRTPSDRLVGRSVLDVTAPDDRLACAAGMTTLRKTRRAFIVTKRMLRGDGSTVRVEQTTALADFGHAAPQVMATVVPQAKPVRGIEPAALLAQARFLRESRQERDAMFGTMLFGNPSWDLLLKAYIAEAEGRAVDIAAMALTARLPVTVALRWARALAAEGLLEIEAGGDPGALPQYRLTTTAHDRLERHLSHRLMKLVDMGVMA